MSHKIIHYREQNESAIDDRNKDAIEAVEEVDGRVDRGSWASWVAEGAWAVGLHSEIDNSMIIRDSIIARIDICVQSFINFLGEGKFNNWVALLFSIETLNLYIRNKVLTNHEIKEGHWTLEGSLGDQWDFLAGLEEGTGIIRIEGEQRYCLVTNQGIRIHLIPHSLD